jgi:O-antigen/teichoic acid export membrane protein
MTVVYGLILPSLLLVWVVAQVGTYLASSSNDTKSLATARVSQGLALAASQVAGGLLSLGVVGLVSALSVSVVVSALCLRKVFPARVRRMRRDELKAFYSKYRRLPMFSMPAALLNAATVRAPSALLTFSYGPELGGQFLFAQTMLGGPVMLASRSLSQAIVGELSTGVGAEGARALRRTVIRGLKQMIMLGVVPSIALMLWGEEIFSLAFGEHWVGAGRICRLLALTFLTGIALVPFGQLLELLGGSRLQLIWDALRLVSVCAVLLVGYLVGWTSDATVMCYGIVLVAFYVIQVVLALRLLTEQAGLRGGTL